MNTSKSWDVNRQTARFTRPIVSVVWQCKLVSGSQRKKQRSAPPLLALWLRKDFTFYFTLCRNKLFNAVGVQTRQDRWCWPLGVRITAWRSSVCSSLATTACRCWLGRRSVTASPVTQSTSAHATTVRYVMSGFYSPQRNGRKTNRKTNNDTMI